MLPGDVHFNGADFHLAYAATGTPDAVIAKGQKIELPAGSFNKVYILAASDDGDQRATFRVGSNPVELNIENWGGFIGQWDTRLWKPEPDSIKVGGRFGQPERTIELRHEWAASANHATWPDVTYRGSPDWSPNYPEDYLGLRPGFIKTATLGWYVSHHHTPDGLNEPYQYSYLFAYPVYLPPHTKTLTLPENEKVRVLAVTVAKDEPAVTPTQPLYDTLK
jgi:alpha-mannosidase